MVRIEIRNSNKVLGNKSLFITFDFSYKVLDIIKSLPSRYYYATTKEWEVPSILLSKLTNILLNEGIDYHITNIDELESKKVNYYYDFKTKCLNHQLEAIDYGLTHNSFLLGDDMGLGKSKEALDLACIRKTRLEVKKCLIICGVNSLKFNWLEEISKHTNERGWILGARKNKNGKLRIGSISDKIEDLRNLCGNCFFMITNIETLRNKDFIREAEKKIISNELDMIIFDEAHTCRNPSASQTEGLLKLKPKYRLAMSGTFMLNRPLDLYVPLNWIDYYKDSQWKFEHSFMNFDSFGNATFVKNLDLLHNIVDDCMLRRRKEDVLDLPEKTYLNEYLEMTDNQASIYEEVIIGLKADIDKIKLSHNPLVELIRARQATGFTGLLSSKYRESAKMDRLVDLVNQIQLNGHKCLVFSNWAKMIDVAVQYLEKFNPAKITGELSDNEVEEQKYKFKNNISCKVCCGTIGKMGTGLTLTEANYVIFLDEPWNKGIKEQASDRVHRIGQRNNVIIITLICKNTMDERINELVEQKGMITDLVVDGKYNTSKLVDFLFS